MNKSISIFLCSGILLLSLVTSWSSNAATELNYDHAEMVRFILKHGPVKRTWDGNHFIETPLFVGEVSEPIVQLVSKEEMLVIVAGQAPGVVAMYDSELKTMFLDKDIDPKSPQGYSIILHELVHHVQNVMGLTDATRCPMSLEYDAYRIQMIYLDNHKSEIDENFYKTMQFSSLAMGAQMICREDG